MIRRPTLPTTLSIAILAAAAIAVGALQIRSDNLAPPDWTALCSPDPDASNRGTRRIILNERERAGFAVRVPIVFIGTSPDSIGASSAIYPTNLTLVFAPPQDPAGIAAGDFTALKPAEKTDTPWLGDQLRMTITAARPHGPTPALYRDKPAAGPADAQSGLAVLRLQPQGKEYLESHEFLAHPDPAQRQAIHACRKNDTTPYRLYLDLEDGIHASLEYNRARLPQAQALEAITRALLRCFIAGGKRA